MPSLVPIDAAVLDQMAAADARGQAGLTPRAFAQFTRALTRTTWGQAHLRPVALVDEAAQLLASALLYRLPAVVDGHPLTICTVGDVIAYGDTAAHAASLIARVTEEVATWCPGASIIATIAAEGAAVPDGFHVVATTESTLVVTESTRRGAPMAPVRSGEHDDLPFLVDVPRLGAPAPRFCIARDVDFMAFTLTRKRLLAGLAASGSRQLWFLVVEEGMRAAAYVVISATEGRWMIESCGDRDPTGARIGAILQMLIAREPAEHRPVISAWLPPGFLPPQVTVASTGPSPVRLCVRALAHAPALDTWPADEVAYWHGDLV
ncbi:hypothetical protein [Luteitalea sp.]|jgi:hypothetical protein|uniref:hypothetical protein n=1 Tax=Luteitalea sp. TaxID=2004800 RepID=UPI0037CC3627